jgi:hypothetical protein
VAIVCGAPPSGRARWSVRLIVEQAIKRKIVPQLGRETLRVLLESHDLKRGGEKMWCLPQIDATYLKRMEDLLALYERPHNPQEPVLCLDEKPVSLHGEVRVPQMARPGIAAKRDSEYKRKGTANVFCAVEPRAGRHFTFPTPRRSGAEFAKVIAAIARRYPCAHTSHLVVDNLNIHCCKSLTDSLGPEQRIPPWNRFTVHYTP